MDIKANRYFQKTKSESSVDKTVDPDQRADEL